MWLEYIVDQDEFRRFLTSQDQFSICFHVSTIFLTTELTDLFIQNHFDLSKTGTGLIKFVEFGCVYQIKVRNPFVKLNISCLHRA